jgi:hypothetical protein
VIFALSLWFASFDASRHWEYASSGTTGIVWRR